MTKEEFYLKMLALKQLKEAGEISTEDVHIDADGLMCKLLTELGYGDGVEVFYNLPKWYS